MALLVSAKGSDVLAWRAAGEFAVTFRQVVLDQMEFCRSDEAVAKLMGTSQALEDLAAVIGEVYVFDLDQIVCCRYRRHGWTSARQDGRRGRGREWTCQRRDDDDRAHAIFGGEAKDRVGDIRSLEREHRRPELVREGQGIREQPLGGGVDGHGALGGLQPLDRDRAVREQAHRR